MDYNHRVNRPSLFLVSCVAIAFLFLGIMLVFSMISVSHAQRAVNLVSNGNFTNKTLAPWTDPLKNCQTNMKCSTNSTTGWKDNTSLQISTNQSAKHALSIRGKTIHVTPGQPYQLTSHLKLNEFVNGSHIAVEAYNQTSKKWDQIMQCPKGTNGPLEWKEFSCEITLPTNTDRIRPVLYAGWSSQQGREALTLFDGISITKAATLNKNNRIGGFIPGGS